MTTSRNNWVYHLFFGFVLVLLLVLAFFMLQPFVHAIFFSILLASLVSPVQQRFIQVLGGRKTLAAMLMTAIVTVVIIMPISMLGLAVVQEGVDTVQQLDTWLENDQWQEMENSEEVQNAKQWAKNQLWRLDTTWPETREKLFEQFQGLAGALLQKGANALGNATLVVTRFPVMLFVLFFLLLDGQRMHKRFQELLPLHSDQTEDLLKRARGMFHAVFIGSLFTAFLQGAMAGLGFWIVGYSPFLWGAVAGVCSFIPILGTGLVFIPLIALTLLNGEFWYALLLTGWGLIMVGPIDNYVRPFLMPKEAKMSPLFLFLAIVGGVLYFGLPGLVYGPLVFGLLTVMLESFKDEYLEEAGAKRAETAENSTT